MICYELRDSRETLIMDSTDDGLIAATGKLDGAVLDGEIPHAGPNSSKPSSRS